MNLHEGKGQAAGNKATGFNITSVEYALVRNRVIQVCFSAAVHLHVLFRAGATVATGGGLGGGSSLMM